MTDAKIQWFPKDLVLKVYYKEDMDIYLKYAIETYGIDFWKLLTDGCSSLQSEHIKLLGD